MKLIALSTALIIASAPAFAESASETFGMKNVGQNTSAAAMDTAVSKLSGDDIENKIVISAPAQTSRNSQGHLQLAKNMGVSPDAVSNAALAKMFIGAYDC